MRIDNQELSSHFQLICIVNDFDHFKTFLYLFVSHAINVIHIAFLIAIINEYMLQTYILLLLSSIFNMHCRK